MGTDHIDGCGESIVVQNLLYGDPFPLGTVAKLPDGLSYVKVGDVWLLAPCPIPKPVLLSAQVNGRGYGGYWLIQQTPYTGGSTKPFMDPRVIRFNIPMSSAKLGDFHGADKPAFPDIVGKTIEEKISVGVSFEIKCTDEKLMLLSEVNAAVTKGHLAKAIALEVEKTLGTPNMVLLAFLHGVFRQEVVFEDLFLADLVQRSKGAFQAYIAIRVRPSAEDSESS
ncbi:hypothetical protein LXA43DRAFT_1007653 [Ganoderma leucocontextum]|nr:hypothetical protein LXA43DRAFT_1007653 [Ganoderma leucocontextum]